MRKTRPALVRIGSLVEVVVVVGAFLVVGSAVADCFCWISGASGRVLSYVLQSSGVLWRSFRILSLYSVGPDINLFLNLSFDELLVCILAFHTYHFTI